MGRRVRDVERRVEGGCKGGRVGWGRGVGVREGTREEKCVNGATCERRLRGK